MNNNQLQDSIFPTQKQALIIVLFTMLVTFLAGFMAISLKFSRSQLLLVEGVTMVPALIFVIAKKLSLKNIFRFRPVNVNIFIVSIFIGLALAILADEADRIIQLIFPMPDIISNALKESLRIETNSDLLIIVFSAVILAAVSEELLFRGFLQTSFENTYDITKAIMITALFFAIVHFNPWWIIQLILFAIFLGVLAWKSNSIIPPIIVHMVNNGIALIFINVDEIYLQWYFWNKHVNPTIILLAGVILIFSLKKFYRYCDEYNKQ